MPSLYLIRGVSGSGKSTLACQLSILLNCNYWEADMYFSDPKTGEYKFNPSHLGQADGWCFQQFYTDVMCKLDVIVANTFATEHDMQQYLDTAHDNGYTVTSLLVENRHGYKSLHDVPEATLQRQETLLRKNIKLR